MFMPSSAATLGWLAGKQVRAENAEFAGDFLFARSEERIEAFAYGDVDEAGLAQHRGQLFTRKSAGDSTRP